VNRETARVFLEIIAADRSNGSAAVRKADEGVDGIN